MVYFDIGVFIYLQYEIFIYLMACIHEHLFPSRSYLKKRYHEEKVYKTLFVIPVEESYISTLFLIINFLCPQK